MVGASTTRPVVNPPIPIVSQFRAFQGNQLPRRSVTSTVICSRASFVVWFVYGESSRFRRYEQEVVRRVREKENEEETME